MTTDALCTPAPPVDIDVLKTMLPERQELFCSGCGCPAIHVIGFSVAPSRWACRLHPRDAIYYRVKGRYEGVVVQ